MRTGKEQLVILDVGHGNCAVLRDKEGTVVFDTGRKAGLMQFLKQENLEEVDLILVSHSDEDHIGGLIGIIGSREFRVKSVFVNADASKGSACWDDLIYELSRLDTIGELVFRNSLTSGKDGVFSRGDIRIEVLGPSKYLATKGPGSKDRKGRKLTPNSTSAVFRIVIANKPLVLLAGDIDSLGLENILESGRDLAASILVYPHHGGRAGAGNAAKFAGRLCELVKPDMVIFSIGRGQHGTPRPEVVRAIQDYSKVVRIACTQLSEQCTGSLPKDEPAHLNKAYAQGREERKCCAGSIVVELRRRNGVLPTFEAHREFIDNVAVTALCRLSVN